MGRRRPRVLRGARHRRPIVLGVSFGGMVAMAYATRHPEHPSKLVLVSTEAAGGSYLERRVAMFERSAGRRSARWRAAGFWRSAAIDQAALEAWRSSPFRSICARRATRTPQAARSPGRRCRSWFTRPGGEGHRFNMFPDLARIRCPTLVMGGEEDPMTPIECQADIAAALPTHLVRFERFADCGHAVIPDAPERAMAVIRDFIARDVNGRPAKQNRRPRAPAVNSGRANVVTSWRSAP